MSGVMIHAKVLLVEDDVDIREVLGQIVESEGYQAVTAQDGEEALDLLRRGELPGLILLDLMMPRMDGWAFRAAQLADPRLAAVPVVLVSADNQVRRVAQELGAAGWIEKPPSLAAIQDVLRRLCGPPAGPAAARAG